MKKKLYHQFACSSLMLPEHRAGLARHRRNRAAEERPAIDEQQLEQLQRLVKRSIAAGLPVTVTFFEKGARRACTGVIPGRQPDPGRLRIQTERGVLAIPVTAIVQVEN